MQDAMQDAMQDGASIGKPAEPLGQRLQAEFPPYRPRPAGAKLALAGIVVLDFSHFLAGPYATMLLADMGADVIKVENTGGGDELRYYPPAVPGLADQGAPFLWTNRSKRSIQIDLKAAGAAALLHDLIARADVLVENFSTGVAERLGLDHAAAAAINPRIICCSISAYGRHGAFAQRRGFDPVAQAESGFMAMNGFADREGVRAQATVMDISAGMMACNAILAALLARGAEGAGQAVEVALYDTAVATMLGFGAMQHLVADTDPQRLGNYSPDTAPTGIFRAADAEFYMSCTSDGIFRRLVMAAGCAELLDDAELVTRAGRLRRRDELFAVLNGIFAQKPWAHWRARLEAAGVPAGEVRPLRRALRAEEARERELVARIAHPELGWIPNIRSPLRFSATPVRDPMAAPALGAHQQEVLGGMLGYSAGRIAELAASGAIPPPKESRS